MEYTECRPGNHNPMSICENCPMRDNCPAQVKRQAKSQKGIKKSRNVKSDTDEDWNGIAYLGSLIEKCEEWSLRDHK